MADRGTGHDTPLTLPMGRLIYQMVVPPLGLAPLPPPPCIAVA